MREFIAASAALFIAASAFAHSTETAIVAAMNLSEDPNYSWTATITDDAQTYDIEGMTAGGFTWQRQPMPKVVARRLGREAGHDLEAIFSAPLRYVIRTESGWRNLEELPKQHDDWIEGDQWYYVTVPAPVVRTPDMPADAGMGSFGLPPAIIVPVLSSQPEDDKKVYSNAQFALALPHEELSILVSSSAEFNVDGEVATGTLTDIGAQLLLVHDGHEYIQPVAAGGRFKIWFNGDTVEKYTVDLAGIVVVDKKTVYVQQKANTVIRDVGTTKVDVPAGAKNRL